MSSWWRRYARVICITITLILLSLRFLSLPLDGYTLKTINAGSLLNDSSFTAASHPYLHPSGRCDPYLQPGYLTTNLTDVNKLTWTAFDPKCPRAPHFLQDVIERKPLPWLQGKTILLVGDSVDRNNLVKLCELLNSSNVRMTMTNNLSAMMEPEPSIANFSRTRMCRIEEYDLEIVNYFFWGLDIAPDDKNYNPAGYIERLFGPLKTMFDDYRRKPDIILLSSGLWDLMIWAKHDAYLSLPVNPAIQPDRLHHWIERAEAYVDLIESYFPKTFMVWRMLHYCKVDWGAWFVKDEPESVDRTPRAPFHEVRVFQMNQAYLELLKRKPRLYKFRWGELFTGQLDNYMDSHHPGFPETALWTNMILYYMSQLKDKT